MPVERIVSLFVVAREGHHFNGTDLIVAAEKAGLEYGDMGIYHRMVDGKRELGPIFSVANMLKPGSFDLSRLDALRTPGLSFFMALPGPITALDAWDTMLPTAQRLAELLDGQVLDEERNALGRQRIAHIRDELRGWDRDHDGGEIRFGR
jgi:cell division protein ZipA